jgi:hypothetical protein
MVVVMAMMGVGGKIVFEMIRHGSSVLQDVISCMVVALLYFNSYQCAINFLINTTKYFHFIYLFAE